MNLELGQTYEFDVIEKVEKSIGNARLRVQDKEGSLYECDMYPFQEEEIPNVVWCKWNGKYDKNGLPSLEQDKGKLLRENFTEGQVYDFKLVSGQKEDYNTGNKYYYIGDDRLGIKQRYYSSKEYPGDSVIRMKVKKIREDKGLLKLKEVSNAMTATPHQSEIDSTTVDTSSSVVQYTPREFGRESHTVEFKTSIVFVPGKSEPSIDEQLSKNIVREIAGFLNAEGGTLYIGVNDKGYPVGMTDDYAHLNDGNDEYNGSYKNTTDSYENKIRHAVEKLLSQRALGNLQFEFPEKYAGNVCVIHIKPLKRPVFFCGNRLYVRTGNRITPYKNDAIIDFIQDRLELQLHDVFDDEQLNLGSSISIDDIKKIIRETYNAQPITQPATTTPTITIPIPTVSTAPKDDEVWKYFTYYATGEYSIQKEEMHDMDIVAQVCVHKSEKDQRILLCYDNGCVASVVPSKIYDSRYRGKRRPKGWNTDVNLMAVFVANTYDLLGAISVDANQGRWVKVHNVSDLGTPKQSMNSKGNTIISPKLGTVSEYKFIPASHRNIIPNLIFQKAETSRSLGVPETMQQYLNEVTYFKKI